MAASRLTEDGCRAPGPAGFARMLGWARLSLYQLPSILQATGLGSPFLCSRVLGRTWRPHALRCGVGAVGLGWEGVPPQARI